jgi:hypothetical protein
MPETNAATVHPSAEAAAEWWAGKLRNPTFDNGDRTGGSDMASLMAHAANRPATDEKIERFRVALAASLSDEIAANPRRAVRVGVDYNPDTTLRNALYAAGLDSDGMTTLPWKTRMRIEPSGEVTVGDGYGVPWKTIYPADTNQA